MLFILIAFPLLCLSQRPNSSNCTTKWFEQTIDHFNWGPLPNNKTTFQQRYLVYENYWKKPNGPIFFYCGNEGDVTAYANYTGLMWENAQNFGAYIIFAEHRYYGESLPFGSQSLQPQYMHWLSVEQALADYSTLIYYLKQNLSADASPVITFGGSYGGMLSAWLKIQFPSVAAGAIAASAPVLAFPGMTPPYNTETYWQVVTQDATAARGSAPNCSQNVRASWDPFFQLASTTDGLAQLSSIFRVCTPLKTSEDVDNLAMFLKEAWDTMAMGNYPYPSAYLTGGPQLPAWPVRVACDYMAGPFADNTTLLNALRDATAVFNNATKDLPCYNVPPMHEGTWQYQWCTEMTPDSSYFETDGVHDMFYPSPYNMTYINNYCQSAWGVTPRPYWIRQTFGNKDLSGANHIVFTNGNYDPWSSGGVPQSLSETVMVVWIDQGAHHLDLMFSDPNDPISVINARAIELEQISIWINQFYSERKTKP